jgi:Ca-activated chloride channel homolog
VIDRAACGTTSSSGAVTRFGRVVGQEMTMNHIRPYDRIRAPISRVGGLLGVAAMAGLALFGCGGDFDSLAAGDGGAGTHGWPEGGDDGPSTEAAPADPVDGEDWAWFQLSPDDSTSMATAQVLKADRVIRGLPLRAHEVVNYYDPPASYREEGTLSRAWALHDGMSISIDGRRHDAAHEGTHGMELLIHAHAPLPPESERRPYTLHLCVDVSGSMHGERIQFTRDALHRLVDALREGDRLSLTTFESHAELVHPTLEVSANRQALHAAIDGLQVGGGTNMRDGLTIAYDEAQRVLDGDSLHRVMLFSDGAANVGETDLDGFAALTSSQYGEGIYLSGVGVGDDYDFRRMNALTDAGRGAHVFLPSADEVGVIFGPMLRKIIEVAADEVSIEVQLPLGFTLSGFSGEEASTDPEERVQNIVLAAGDDFTLLADFVTADEALFDEDMILTYAYTPLGGDAQMFEARFPIADLFETTSGLVERTSLLAWYGEVGIAGFPAAETCSLRDALLAFEPMDAGMAEVAEILGSRATCD